MEAMYTVMTDKSLFGITVIWIPPSIGILGI